MTLLRSSAFSIWKKRERKDDMRGHFFFVSSDGTKTCRPCRGRRFPLLFDEEEEREKEGAGEKSGKTGLVDSSSAVL